MNAPSSASEAAAAAYYTFAANPSMQSLWFWLAVVLLALPLLAAIRHENEIGERYRDRSGRASSTKQNSSAEPEGLE